MRNFIISYNCQHLLVLFDASLNNFSQLEAELQQFSKELDFFSLENSTKLRLSKFQLLGFVSITFSRSLYISSRINRDREIENIGTKSCLKV